MKILEPVEKDQIPRWGKYTEIYKHALSANGLAVPVEFESEREARNLQSTMLHRASIARRLGLAISVHGKTAFVYHKDSP